jgi:hypothetical protein
VQKFIKEEENAEKDEALKKLEKAFVALHEINPDKKELLPLMITILSRYGRRLYPQFQQALPYLLASLQLQLQHLGHLEEIDFDSFTSLDKFQQNPQNFSNLVKFIEETNEHDYESYFNRLSQDEMFEFGQTLFTLGCIYSNLREDHFKMEKAAFHAFKSNLFASVKCIYLSLVQTPAIQEQLGELQYNIFPNLYLNQCKLSKGEISKDDLDHSFGLLDHALQYNSSLPMQARIANLKACLVYEHLGDASLGKEYAKESLKLWEDVLNESHLLTSAQQEKYGGLYATVNNNYLSFLIKCGHWEEAELETYAKVSRGFYEKAKETHPYSMIFAYNLARLEKIRNNSDRALLYLDEIENISQHYLDWPDTKNYLAKGAELRLEIQQTLI